MNLFTGKYIYLFCIGLLLIFFLYRRDRVSFYESFQSSENVMLPEFTENVDIDSKRLQTNQLRMNTFIKQFDKEYEIYQNNTDYILDENDPTKKDKKKYDTMNKAYFQLYIISTNIYSELHKIEQNYDEFTSNGYIGDAKEVLERKKKMIKQIGQFLLNGNGKGLDEKLKILEKHDRVDQNLRTEKALKEFNDKMKDKKDDELYEFSTNTYTVKDIQARIGGFSSFFKILRIKIHEFVEIKQKDPTRDDNGDQKSKPDEMIKSVKFKLSGNVNPVG